MRASLPAVATVCVFFCSLTGLHAQTLTPDRNQLEIEGTGTLTNMRWQGQTLDRHLFEIGVSYERLLTKRNWGSMSFASEAVPFAALREPILRACPFDPITLQCVGPFFTGLLPEKIGSFSFPFESTGYRTSYAAGAAPVGFVFRFLPERHVQPFVGVRGGFLYFNRNVLADDASQFNFTLDGRAGVRIPLPDGKAISVAYMFQHMSNKGISRDNPGMDSHMISLSYSFPLLRGKKK